jgi:hypothetical protein
MPSRRPGRGLGIAGLAAIALAGAVGAWWVAGLFDEPTFRLRDRSASRPEESGHAVAPPGVAPAARLVLSEGEVRTLVSAHVPQTLGIAVSGVAAALPGDGVIDAAIRVPARVVVDRSTPLLGRLLPGGWLTRPMWLVMTLRPRVSADSPGQRRHLRLEVAEFRVGSRRLPASAVGVVLSTDRLERLQLPLPRGVDSVTVERGRLVLSGGS